MSGGPGLLDRLVDDLQRIFASRLRTVAAYGWHRHPRIPSLALVESLHFDDLTACALRTSDWHRHGIETPLLLTLHEFSRSLDAFPIEYDEILATRNVVYGDDPFRALTIEPADLRRACEVQVKSHLVHLRENYLEGRSRPGNVAALVTDSAPAFASLLRHLARLDGAPLDTTNDLLAFASTIGLDARVVSDLLSLTERHEVASVDPTRIFPAYLAAVERLAAFVDQWRR